MFELYSVPSHERGTPEITLGRAIGSNKRSVEPGTVLLCRINPRINRVWVTGDHSDHPKIASTEWIPFFPLAQIEPRYLAWFLRQDPVRDYAAGNASGVGGSLMRVRAETFRDFKLPLAPRSEQSRIADTLDELFSDLDAGVAALQRAREKLSLYRASVLKAAVEGSLTADWRRRNPQAEPSGELLKRILVERRRRWEKDQTRKFREKGKTPPRNWKARYKEPVAPDVAELPALPEGWCWASLDQLAEVVGGITKGQKFADRVPTREVPYLRVANVQRGYLDLEEVKQIRARESDIEMYRLEPGDILFTEGGDRDKLGRGWIWNREIDECVHQNHVFRARPISEQLQSRVISWSGNSYGQLWFSKAGRQSVNLASINLTVLRSFPVPVAPVVEQQQIVEAVEDQLSTIEHLEADIGAKLESAQALRQAILKHAFSGKLVPQDPNDEPASELLERIAAEREAREEAASAKRSAGARGKTRRRRRSRTSQRRGSIDFDELETERRRLGIKGDEERWPKEFDDPTFSRQVLGLEEEE